MDRHKWIALLSEVNKQRGTKRDDGGASGHHASCITDDMMTVTGGEGPEIHSTDPSVNASENYISEDPIVSHSGYRGKR